MVSAPQSRLSRLALGTVQLGMDYGRVIPTKPPEPSVVHDMFDLAVASGVRCFDCAPAYGDAEAAIGRWLAEARANATAESPSIVTKLPALESFGESDIPAAVRHALAGSKRRLGIERIDGYLVHRASDLHRTGVADTLRALVEDGEIAAFGVSVYGPEEITAAMEVPGLSLVQAPLSVFDRRIVGAGALAACAERGITVFARSVFLQGLVFVDPAALPAHFDALRPRLAALGDLAKKAGVSIAAICLQAVMNEPGIASTVIGAARPDQLLQNLAAAREDVPPEILDEARGLGEALNASIIDPRRWP